MKTNVFLIATLLLIVCFSWGQKNYVATAHETILITDQKLPVLNEPLFQQTFVSPREWRAYKKEARLKIHNHKIRISELKAKMRQSGDGMDKIYQVRIEMLENKNKNLKNRIDRYKRNRSDWASFKRDFGRELDDLGQSIKDFSFDKK